MASVASQAKVTGMVDLILDSMSSQTHTVSDVVAVVQAIYLCLLLSDPPKLGVCWTCPSSACPYWEGESTTPFVKV